MKETIEIKGYWWLPNNPENRVAGIFRYEPNERLRLELIGSFETTKQLFENLNSDEIGGEKLIYGEMENSKAVTLINCNKGYKANFSCSFSMAHYSVQYALIGIELKDIEEKVFNKIVLRLPLLSYWMNRSGLKLSIPFNKEKSEGYDLSYRTYEQRDINITLTDTLLLSIEHSITIPDIYKEESSIEQVYYASIQSQDCVSFDFLLKKSIRFRNFISMATLTNNNFVSLSLRCPELYQELNNGQKIYDKIELFYKQPDTNEDYEKRQIKKDYLFTHNKIEDEFPSIIKCWFSFDKEMLPILSHLIESVEAKKYFSSVDFLIVTQALEGYHYRFFDREREKEKKLPARLKNLTNEFRTIQKTHDINIDAVVDSRNYYSHLFAEDKKKNIKTGAELFKITKKLKLLLIACILKETGFEMEKINGLLNSVDIFDE